MGLSLANEVLLFGKKMSAEDLEKARFIKYVCLNMIVESHSDTHCACSKVFPEQSVTSFHSNVRAHLVKQLEGLDPEALLTVKRLIKAGMSEKNSPEAVNLRESYAQAEQFAGGVPQGRFGQLARKEIRHKL